MTQTIHELNCGTMRPISRRLINGTGGLRERARLICRCLLVSRADGWVLVDTGLGTDDLADPARRLGDQFLARTRPVLDPSETALAQVQRLGIPPEDVRDIVLTHLDLDHAGGLGDFPWARVHVSARQHALIVPTLDPRHARRLHPPQWSHGPRWHPHELMGVHHGRPAARILPGLSLVALDGHLEGHCGVVIARDGQSDLIHAGDAIFSHRTLTGRHAPAGLALFERTTRTDRTAWSASRRWLRERAAGGDRILCAHDPIHPRD